MPPLSSTPIKFGKFTVTPAVCIATHAERIHQKFNDDQVFHLTPLTMAFVNLKPLLPGHVLVSPLRVAPRLSDLSTDELTDFMLTIRRVSRMLERVYGASALNIAMQDGPDAGQSVPHVHMHLIPRKAMDMDDKGGNDEIYAMIEAKNVGKEWWERERPKMEVQDDESRKARSEEEMRKEAEWLRGEMEGSRL